MFDNHRPRVKEQGCNEAGSQSPPKVVIPTGLTWKGGASGTAQGSSLCWEAALRLLGPSSLQLVSRHSWSCPMPTLRKLEPQTLIWPHLSQERIQVSGLRNKILSPECSLQSCACSLAMGLGGPQQPSVLFLSYRLSLACAQHTTDLDKGDLLRGGALPAILTPGLWGRAYLTVAR